MRRWVNAAGLAAALSGALVVAACGSDTNQRTDERYCAAVQQHLAELNTPSIVTPADIARTVELYRTIAATAPLSVEQEWNVLAIAYETASTVEPGDQASMQKAADTIRASQKSATAVAQYTQRLCNAQIGPSIVATTLLSGTTTTDPDAPSTAAGETTTTVAAAVGVTTTAAGGAVTSSAVPPTTGTP